MQRIAGIGFPSFVGPRGVNSVGESTSNLTTYNELATVAILHMTNCYQQGNNMNYLAVTIIANHPSEVGLVGYDG